MPLIIQLPDKAPISNKMIKATATPSMLLQIACSISFHLTRHTAIAKIELTAVVVSNTTWLAPLNASLPNVRMVINNKNTNTRIGISERRGDGVRFEQFFIFR